MGPDQPTRREILKSASLAPIVFGLAALGCRHEPVGVRGKPWSPTKDGPPSWWNQAYEWTKGGKRVGVAIRIPKDRAVAKALGTNLVDLCARGTLDERLLFAEAVFVCLSDAQIEALVKGAKPEDDAFVFDDRPHRIDGAAISAADAADRTGLGETLRALVEGPKGEKLAALAAERRAAATKEQLESYDRLPIDESGSMSYEFPDALWPALYQERRTTADGARRAKIDAAVSRGLDARLMPRVNVEQPYGVEMSSEGGGCGGLGSNVACGMAMPTPSSYRFIGYLTTPG